MIENPKRCTGCDAVKPATPDYFSRDKQKSDGLRSTCKECDKLYRIKNKERLAEYWREYNKKNKQQQNERSRQYYKENRESQIKRKIEYRSKDKERWAAYDREYQKRYKEENGEKITQRQKRYYLANKGERLSYYREWYERNKNKIIESVRTYVRRRRARKRGLPDTLTPAQWQRCLDYFNGQCAVCGRSTNGLFHTINADHWIPLSDPGCPGTVVENMVPLCGGQDGCNQSKGTKPAAEWLTEKFGPQKAAEILTRINAYFDWVRSQDA